MNVIRGHSNHNIFPLMHCALTHFVSARFSPQLPSNPSGDDRYLDVPDQIIKDCIRFVAWRIAPVRPRLVLGHIWTWPADADV